jgi:hypothetical protein
MAENKFSRMLHTAQTLQGGHDETPELAGTGKVGRPPGKRSNPNYKRLTVLVKKQTAKRAERLWDDLEPSKDMSDLVEQLLADWVQQHSNN